MQMEVIANMFLIPTPLQGAGDLLGGGVVYDENQQTIADENGAVVYDQPDPQPLA
jgi:hypothetical protein